VGKKLITETLSAPHTISLDISRFKAGIYIVKIIATDGTSVQEKLVVEAH
jgi:hypothetical protein